MSPINLQAEERAFQTLFELIRTREIRPGERVYETELAERFSMSRTPLRHAMGRLAAEGMLEKIPGKKGYFLPPLERQDMIEVFSARAAIEGMAAAILSEKPHPRVFRDLRDIISRQRDLFSIGSRKGDYASLNGAFHFTLVKGAGNKYLQRSFSPIYWRSIMYTLLYATFYTEIEETFHVDRVPSWEQHSLITDTIESGNKNEARKRIEAHVLENCEYWKGENAGAEDGNLYIPSFREGPERPGIGSSKGKNPFISQTRMHEVRIPGSETAKEDELKPQIGQESTT